MKELEDFLTFLDDNKIHKLSPNRFTDGEIMEFANRKGFHFTRDELHLKLNQLAKYDGELSEIEKSWRLL